MKSSSVPAADTFLPAFSKRFWGYLAFRGKAGRGLAAKGPALYITTVHAGPAAFLFDRESPA